ncbi:MAG: protein kinase, partial [Bacteroidaceae bacterium]|nr:protein kinase [Bacteroidaceae bacterium]
MNPRRRTAPAKPSCHQSEHATQLRNVNHPNIIKLHEIKQTLNNFYLVFEFCNGGGLSNCLERYMKNNGKPFTQEIVQHIMKQIVSGIQYLHNNKI